MKADRHPVHKLLQERPLNRCAQKQAAIGLAHKPYVLLFLSKQKEQSCRIQEHPETLHKLCFSSRSYYGGEQTAPAVVAALLGVPELQFG